MSLVYGQGPFLNGFDLEGSSIPVSQIVRGGPPRDGIPSIDAPKFLPGNEADFLLPDDLVIGLTRNGISRAYPFRIMLWHEVVNDRFGDEPLVVTYCPLCGTAVVFEGIIGGRELTFGVSGLLFQSDVLMYDRQTESLWSQLMLRAVTGSQKDQALTIVPSQVLTWAAWQKKHPNTEVLSTDTGFNRNYSRNPYAGYEQNQSIWFSVPLNRTEFENKDLVLGVLLDGKAKAYAIPTIQHAGLGDAFMDMIGNTPIEVSYDAGSREANLVHGETREPIPFIQSFWFAWQAFYPETEIWSPIRVELQPDGKLQVFGERGASHVIESTEDFKSWTTIDEVVLSEESLCLDIPSFPEMNVFYRARRTP